MGHAYVSSLYHIVFSTKERKQTLAPALQKDLWAYMGGIARKNRMKALSIGGVEDHVHMLVSMPSNLDFQSNPIHQRGFVCLDARDVPGVPSRVLARRIRRVFNRQFAG